MAAKFDTGVTFRKLQMCAKFHCPSPTLFMERFGAGHIKSRAAHSDRILCEV